MQRGFAPAPHLQPARAIVGLRSHLHAGVGAWHTHAAADAAAALKHTWVTYWYIILHHKSLFMYLNTAPALYFTQGDSPPNKSWAGSQLCTITRPASMCLIQSLTKAVQPYWILGFCRYKAQIYRVYIQ